MSVMLGICGSAASVQAWRMHACIACHEQSALQRAAGGEAWGGRVEAGAVNGLRNRPGRRPSECNKRPAWPLWKSKSPQQPVQLRTIWPP